MEEVSKLPIDVQLTLFMMGIQTCILAIQTVLIVGSLVVAFKIANKWPEQSVGNKRIDLAIDLEDAASALREAFKNATGRFGDAATPNHRHLYGDIMSDYMSILRKRRANLLGLIEKSNRLLGSGLEAQASIISEMTGKLEEAYHRALKKEQLTAEDEKLIGEHFVPEEIEKALSGIVVVTNKFTK